MDSLAARVVPKFYPFKYHTLEDIAGMVYDHQIGFGQGADIIGDLLSKRYPGVVNYRDIQESLFEKSNDNRDYFRNMYDFGKALERLV
ncbi:hypothetical protein HOG07_00730 [Candidatus Woesearchaeota archaeon]|nr:hypothetical protein [Candidatus Woesearchaeota archaeon]